MPQSDQYQLKLSVLQMGAAGCVAGIYRLKGHFARLGADMDRSNMHLMDIDRPYIAAAKTNVFETLKRVGWKPPSEDKEMQKKWKMYRSAVIQNEEKLK